MTDTVNVAIATPDVWVAALTKVTSGVVSIAGNGQHCIHTGAPATTLVGHRFTGNMQPFTLVAGESLYVKADGVTTVIITED